MRTAYEAHAEDNDFIQPGTLYREVMTPTDRDHLAANIVWHLSQGVERFIQERAVNDYWAKVDPDLGARIARELGIQTKQPYRREGVGKTDGSGRQQWRLVLDECGLTRPSSVVLQGGTRCVVRRSHFALSSEPGPGS